MERLEVAGAELAYVVEGQGDRTLAFAHGWLSRLDHWDAQAEHFAASNRVVRWDRRGMCRSRAGVPADSARRHADDLAAILDQEKIEKVVIIGHAGGGPTALTFAAAYPERAEGLVFVDSHVHNPATGSAFVEQVEGLIGGIEGDDPKTFMATVYPGFFGSAVAPEVVAEAVANAIAVEPVVMAEELRHMIADNAAVAAEVKCPVLSLSADAEDTAGVRAIFNDVEVGHVVGSGHFVQLEVPEQFNAMLADFVGRL